MFRGQNYYKIMNIASLLGKKPFFECLTYGKMDFFYRQMNYSSFLCKFAHLIRS